MDTFVDLCGVLITLFFLLNFRHFFSLLLLKVIFKVKFRLMISFFMSVWFWGKFVIRSLLNLLSNTWCTNLVYSYNRLSWTVFWYGLNLSMFLQLYTIRSNIVQQAILVILLVMFFAQNTLISSICRASSKQIFHKAKYIW